MADLPQVIAAYDALVGVALGAGLTFGFGALNRRHQETREDATRWYVPRYQAYSELSRAMFQGALLAYQEDESGDEKAKAAQALSHAVGQIRLVGSPEAVEAAECLLGTTTRWMMDNQRDPEALHLRAILKAFEEAARKDLGHP